MTREGEGRDEVCSPEKNGRLGAEINDKIISSDSKQRRHTAVLVDGHLIGSVLAVFGLITDPRLRNTASVVTAKQSRLTVPLIAVSLVRPVTAVLCAVTDLERQRAVEVVALELARPAVTHR